MNSLFDHAARYHGDAEIVSIGKDGGFSQSDWATVSKQSRELTSALQAAGCVQGDRCMNSIWIGRLSGATDNRIMSGGQG